MLLLLLLSSVIYLAHAASIKVPSPNGREIDAKTPWDLIEAIYGTSGLRSFNGTWITGEWVVTSRYQCTVYVRKHVVNILSATPRLIPFPREYPTGNFLINMLTMHARCELNRQFPSGFICLPYCSPYL